MSGAYSPESWDLARTLVVRDGYSYSDAASKAGVGLSALQKRASKEGWQAAREEQLSRRQDYRSDVFSLKHKLLQAAKEDGDPQKVHAWNVVERAFPEHRYADLTLGEKQALATYAIERVVEHLAEVDANVLEAFRPYIRSTHGHLVEGDWQVSG